MPSKEIKEIILSIFKVNPFKIIPKKRIIIGIILLVGIALLLFQSLLGPRLLQLKALRFLSFSQKRLLECKETITQNPTILLKTMEDTKSQFTELKSKFIVEKDLPSFFDDLRELVNKTGSHLVSLDLKPLVPIRDFALAEDRPAYYQRLPLTMALSGDYISNLLLINKLEEDPRLIEIKNIKLSASGEGSKVTMDLELDFYVIKD
jgi:Tfp pilus assembly protein PilO